MEEIFEIPVLYKGKELLFPAGVMRYGYVHRIRPNETWMSYRKIF